MSESVIEEVAEQSRSSFPPLQALQKRWEVAVAEALEPVSAFDPTIREGGVFVQPEKNIHNGKKWIKHEAIQEKCEIPFKELSAARALRHEGGSLGVDFRPHLFDKKLNSHILCDSGSQICAWPPDPEDKPLADTHLRAVNGTKINCFNT